MQSLVPRTLPNSKLVVVKFLDVFICEIKRRPILWDNKLKQDNYGIRKKMTEEWKKVAQKFNRPVEELKTKWRNLRDTFYREERKLKLPLVDEGKPLMHYYTGHWDKFEQLIFLHNTRMYTRSKEEYIEVNESEISTDNINIKNPDVTEIKVECDESFNDSDSVTEEEQPTIEMILNKDARCLEIDFDRYNTSPAEALEKASNSGNGQNVIEIRETGIKRTLDDSKDVIASKKRATDPLQVDMDIDEDMLVKTLVPFLRKLNPVRKLIVRNELQTLLLKELLCDYCRTNGLQPNCRCYYS
ncbi:hypothetical protein ABMA28_007962 [Loxostege sticticalis]|uniref:MADF domain-containing protein n=1 Tax=Loxostege sticticalis TaxID=481309 RepID=A0ABD0SJG6_LOXSC